MGVEDGRVGLEREVGGEGGVEKEGWACGCDHQGVWVLWL